MFHAPKRHLDHIASTLAFVLVLGTWIAAYAVICPADPLPHHTHVAQVRP